MSAWQVTNEGVCSLDPLVPSNICVPAGTIGNRTVTYQCVPVDTQGPNFCTSSDLDPSAPSQQFFVGDTYTINLTCLNYPNDICGNWQTVNPPPPSGTVSTMGFEIASCQFTDVLDPSLLYPGITCQTDATFPFDILKEGVLYDPLSCVTNASSTAGEISEINTAPIPIDLTNVCSADACGTVLITSEDIVNVTVPDDYNPFICPSESGTVAPQIQQNVATCATPCRVIPLSGIYNIGNGDLDFLYGNIFIASIPNVGFISAAQIPATDGQVVLFRDTRTTSTQVLDDTPLYVFTDALSADGVTDDLTRDGCSQEKIEEDTGIVFSIGPREVDGNSFISQFNLIIDLKYLGWLGIDSINPIWEQAYNIYNGPGITSDQADLFVVELLSPLDTTGSPGSRPFIGKAVISIKFGEESPGTSIIIPGTDNNQYTLDEVEITVFDPDSFTNFFDRNARVCSDQDIAAGICTNDDLPMQICNLNHDPIF